MYELAALDYLWAALAAAGLTLPLGFAGSFVWQPRTVSGIYYLVFGLLLGWAAGTVVSEVISRVTGGKRGVPVQLIAGAGVVAAGVLRLVIAGDIDIVHRDVGGMLAVAVGVAIAWNRLR